MTTIEKAEKKLSVSIMAHPSREDFFPYLRERLGDVPMAIDRGVGIWENCKNAWRLHTDAEWHVVIQDDAIVCDDFYARAEAEIKKAEALGCECVSFFFGNRKAMEREKAMGDKDGHVLMHWVSWGVAIALRREHIEPMIAHGDGINIKQDDTRIAKYVKMKNVLVYYPIPSLVDHRVGESLVGDHPNRTAYRYAN